MNENPLDESRASWPDRTRDRSSGPARGRHRGRTVVVQGREGADADAVGDRQLELVIQIARIATADLELRAMLARIVEAVRAGFQWQFVAFASVDNVAGRFVCEALSTELPSEVYVGYSRELGSGVVGQVALSGRAVVIDDVREAQNYVETLPGVRSELCVPVLHRGEVLGVINAESVEPNAFRHQLRVLETIADQLGGAIAGARLHRELGRRAALLAIMSEVAHTALGGDRLSGVLERIAVFVHRRFALVFCSILLVSDDGDTLVASAGAGEFPLRSNDGRAISVTRGVVGRAFRTGVPQFVPDVMRDPDYVMGNAAVAAEFAVPIRHHDRLLGVINMEAVTAEAFDPDTRTALCALADQVAGAIHLATVNGRLSQALDLVERQRAELANANAQLAAANGELERLSLLDGLTSVANRRRFDAALDAEWRRARRHGHALSLLLVDVDHFKAFNDEYGHLAGDDALRRLATALSATLLRADDVLARYGGEEFAVLLPNSGPEEAQRCAENLRAAAARLALPHRGSPTGVLTISIGGACVTPAMATALALVAAADGALYAAKGGGRDRVTMARAD